MPRTNITLFKEKGPENTKKCFELVSERMEKLDIEEVVVATTTGKTGAEAVKFFENKEKEVTAVSHQYGYKEDGKIKLKDQYRDIMEKSENASLVITPDLLTRIPKIIRNKYGGRTYLDLIADTLRMFSQGMKVCIECVSQAADTGKIPANEEIAAIAGTVEGADTGIILESKHSNKMLDTDIREIICMPREK